MTGIDISTHNSVYSYPMLAAGVDFAVIKASQGHLMDGSAYLFVDSKFYAHMKGCIAAKIPVAVYHFLTAESAEAAEREASFFCDAIEPWKEYIMYAFCDCENYGSNKWLQGISRAELTRRVNAFCGVAAKRGYRAAHYTNVDHINSYINLRDIPYPVWVADYRRGAKKPSYNNVIAWQYTEEGKIGGVYGDVDLNRGYFPELAAVYRLFEWGVINSPKYWAEHYGDVPYLGELLVNCAEKISAKGARMGDVGAAIRSLHEQGVINTPGYWEQHKGDIGNLEELLKALGGCRYAVQ